MAATSPATTKKCRRCHGTGDLGLDAPRFLACPTCGGTGRVELPAKDPVAEGRREDDPCQRGTVGCSVDHRSDSACETW